VQAWAAGSKSVDFRSPDTNVISFNSGASLLSYLTAKTSQNAGSAGGGTSSSATSTDALSIAAATKQVALQAAGKTPQNSTAIRTLDKQQAALGNDLRAAMNKANVKLTGTIEFSVGSDGAVDVKGNDADKAAVKAFLKADTGLPSFANRIATQAKSALDISSKLQERAAISQAARYAGASGNVMAMYSSLMAQGSTTTAVFSVSTTSSSLSYPGSLSTKA
jgi:hypothetical protein